MDPWLAALLFVLAEYLVFLIPVALVGLWITGARETSFLVFATVVVSLVVSYAMSAFYGHPTPCAVSETVVSCAPENSFPSQHTTVTFAMVWPLLVRHRRRLAGLFLVAAIVVGVARIAVGFHYPVDVLGGIAASLVGSVIVESSRNYVATVGRWAIRVDDYLRSLARRRI